MKARATFFWIVAYIVRATLVIKSYLCDRTEWWGFIFAGGKANPCFFYSRVCSWFTKMGFFMLKPAKKHSYSLFAAFFTLSSLLDDDGSINYWRHNRHTHSATIQPTTLWPTQAIIPSLLPFKKKKQKDPLLTPIQKKKKTKRTRK